jgi:hypothetical protein
MSKTILDIDAIELNEDDESLLGQSIEDYSLDDNGIFIRRSELVKMAMGEYDKVKLYMDKCEKGDRNWAKANMLKIWINTFFELGRR